VQQEVVLEWYDMSSSPSLNALSSSPNVNAFRQLLGKHVPRVPVLNVHTNVEGVLTDYVEAGKITVLDFWTTWCLGCPDSLDALELVASKEKYAGKVNFIAVNMDSPEKTRMEIDHWPHIMHVFVNEENKLKYVRGEFGVKFIPHCSVIDKQGVVIQNGGNFYADFMTVDRELTRLLNVPA